MNIFKTGSKADISSHYNKLEDDNVQIDIGIYKLKSITMASLIS